MEKSDIIEDLGKRKSLLGIAEAVVLVVVDTKSVFADTLEESKEIINRTIKASGLNEFNFFLSFFGLVGENEEKIIEKIIQIQNEGGLEEDGIIGNITLEYIYKNYYSLQKEKLSTIQRYRLEIAEEMANYKNKQKAINGKKIKATSIPDVWNNNRFFGGEDHESIEWYEPTEEHIYGKERTFVSKRVFDTVNWEEIKKTFSFKSNSIYIFQNEKEYIFVLFNENGTLTILSNTSPGLDDYPSIHKKKVNTVRAYPNINHVSSSYPEEVEKGNIGGAPMPYAVDIYGGYKIHGSADIVDGKKRSHGCFRLPLFYAKGLYEYTKRYSPKLYIGDLGYNK